MFPEFGVCWNALVTTTLNVESDDVVTIFHSRFTLEHKASHVVDKPWIGLVVDATGDRIQDILNAVQNFFGCGDEVRHASSNSTDDQIFGNHGVTKPHRRRCEGVCDLWIHCDVILVRGFDVVQISIEGAQDQG